MYLATSCGNLNPRSRSSGVLSLIGLVVAIVSEVTFMFSCQSVLTVLLAVAWSLASAPALAESPPDAEIRQPNIVVILVDTLRADHLGCYGNASGHTPNIDAIAAEGVRFERMISSAPWTQPSMASFFCSLYPGVHKVTQYRQPKRTKTTRKKQLIVFDDSFETLAELLRSNGYSTAAIVANPLLLKEYGFGQGFEHFDTSFANNSTRGEVINNAAKTWLSQRDTSKPFFLYLHYMDPHGPYDASMRFFEPLLDAVEANSEKVPMTPKQSQALKYLGGRVPASYMAQKKRHRRLHPFKEYWSAAYQAGVRQADHYLGLLHDDLAREGLWGDTVVIITSDHGEALCEHDLWEHGWSVHHTDAHIPMIIRWPGVAQPERSVSQTSRSIDLMPTMLDQLKIPLPAGLQGVSLLPLLLEEGGTPASTGRSAFIESVKLGDEQKGIYVGDFKFMVTQASGWMGLYNIEDDPYEQNNLIEHSPEDLARLRSALGKQLLTNQQRAEGFVPEATSLSPEQLERLRSLGYVE